MTTEDLIIRSLQGRATPEEEAHLQALRKSSPESDRAYRRMAEIWSLTAAAAPGNSSAPAPSDAEIDRLIARAAPEVIDIARQPSGNPTRPRQSSGERDRSSWRRAAGKGLLAASIALVAFSAGLLLDRFVGAQEALAYSEVVTGAEERTTVTLLDGTAVRLGPNSRLRFTTAAAEQEPVIWLEGRAYVGVVPDPDRTFIVRTAYGDAKALGTRFEVRTDEDEFRVMVVEGNVQVSSAGSSVELAEGSMSRSSRGVPPVTSLVDDVYDQLDWIGSTLVFRGTPLPRVLDEIERHYGVPIDLEKESLQDVTVTATFTDEAVGEVVFVVCQTVGAGCRREDSRYLIGDRTVGQPREQFLAPPA